MESDIRRSSRKLRGKTLVFKISGRTLGNSNELEKILEFLRDLTSLGVDVVLVHGGGPQISIKLKEARLDRGTVQGLRITPKDSLPLIRDALTNENHHLVGHIRKLGGKAQSVGPGQRILVVEPHELAEELRFVATVKRVKIRELLRLLRQGTIPVVVPMAIIGGNLYNINADDVAGAIASALGAYALVILVEVKGILRCLGSERTLIKRLTVQDAEELLEGVVNEGMIPKVKACLEALRAGVPQALILEASSATLFHRLLLNEEVGTTIVRGRSK